MTLSDFIKKYDPNKFNKPFIIAEAGVNHEGSLETAKKIIDQAKEGGADAVKFQSYKADKIAVKNSPAYWDLSHESTKTQFLLFKKYDKFWKKEFIELKKYCSKVEIEFLSTPFDNESADFLNDLMGSFKISSSDLNNRPFIEKICKFNKPIILSTGASYFWEIEQAVDLIKIYGNKLALLHCILNYPTLDENANLSKIPYLIKNFPEIPIGYSDHTLPKKMKILETAFSVGARIIEKHFTNDKNLPGNDHYHSMDLKDLKLFNKRVDTIMEIMGDSKKEVLDSEKISRSNARRSLVSSKFIPEGKIIEIDDIIWKRPGEGIDPREIEKVLGLKAKKNIKDDTVLIWDYLTN